MPALFSLGMHRALTALQTKLQPGERVFAFLDDLYIVAAPERVRTLFDAVARRLYEEVRISLNHAKTRVWNAPPLRTPPGTGGLCMLAVGKPGSLRARLGSAHAAGCQGGSGLGQHVAPQGQLPIDIGSRMGRERKQASSICSVGSRRKERAPPPGKARKRKSRRGAPARPWPEPLQAAGQDQRLRCSTARPPRWQAQQGGIWNCLASARDTCALLSSEQGAARPPPPDLAGAGCGCQSRHQGSVDGKLSAAPQGQAIGNDFDAAVVSGDTGDVQVPYQRVHADGGTSLPTHSGGCTFEWDAAPAQDTRPRASGPVVPQGVTHTTTRAPGRAEWQRHA